MRWVGLGIACLTIACAKPSDPGGTAPDPVPSGPPEPGALWLSPSGAAFRWVPSGTYTMGSPEAEVGRGHDEAQHEVSVTGLWVMQTEVTQGLWSAAGGSRRGEGQPHDGTDDSGPCSRDRGASMIDEGYPVVCVDWFEAVRFANALSVNDGLGMAYRISGETVIWDRGATGYRLLTEAEWEYAARGGVRGEMFSGAPGYADVCKVGNVRDPQRSGVGTIGPEPCRDRYIGPAPVESFHPNAWGLADLTGNVWEWVWDRYHSDYGSDPVQDPSGPPVGAYRVLRGGSWDSPRQSGRVACRNWSGPTARDPALGLRLARPAP